MVVGKTVCSQFMINGCRKECFFCEREKECSLHE
jgi:hypothetical protein